MSILLLSPEADIHATYVHDILKSKKQHVTYFDFWQYPERSQIGLHLSDANQLLLHTQSLPHGLDLHKVRSFLYRRPGRPKYRQGSAPLKTYIEKESLTMLRSLVALTPQALWLPNPETARYAEKPVQLFMAQACGLQIPSSCIGNSPTAVETFIERHHDLALKPLESPNFFPKLNFLQRMRKRLLNASQGLGFTSESPDEDSDKLDYRAYLTLLTKRYRRSEIQERIPQFSVCPVILQHYIPKQLELRITVVGKKIFACALHSQASNLPDAIRTDWRSVPEALLKHEPFQLPEEVKDKCLMLLKRLNLQFGCIDMVLTPAGEYVFLEVNTNGQWLWVEQETKLPIGEAIADLLISHEGL